MFEAAEIGSRLSKRVFEREAPKIRTELLAAQTRLANEPLAVVVLIGGVEGAGKGETVNLLLEWMDARGIEVHAMWDPTDEERERPPMWRFWRVHRFRKDARRRERSAAQVLASSLQERPTQAPEGARGRSAAELAG